MLAPQLITGNGTRTQAMPLCPHPSHSSLSPSLAIRHDGCAFAHCCQSCQAHCGSKQLCKASCMPYVPLCPCSLFAVCIHKAMHAAIPTPLLSPSAGNSARLQAGRQSSAKCSVGVEGGFQAFSICQEIEHVGVCEGATWGTGLGSDGGCCVCVGVCVEQRRAGVGRTTREGEQCAFRA